MISDTERALKRLRELDRLIVRRILNFMDQWIAPLTDPRSQGEARQGPAFATLWRYPLAHNRIVYALQHTAIVIPTVWRGHLRRA